MVFAVQRGSVKTSFLTRLLCLTPAVPDLELDYRKYKDEGREWICLVYHCILGNLANA